MSFSETASSYYGGTTGKRLFFTFELSNSKIEILKVTSISATIRLYAWSSSTATKYLGYYDIIYDDSLEYSVDSSNGYSDTYIGYAYVNTSTMDSVYATNTFYEMYIGIFSGVVYIIAELYSTCHSDAIYSSATLLDGNISIAGYGSSSSSITATASVTCRQL